MAREEVSFARGSHDTIPSTRVPGRLLVETDTGDAFIDDTSESRIQLKDSTKLALSGGTMTGAINMGSNKITNLATPTDDSDAATKSYVDTQISDVEDSIPTYTGGTGISISGTVISHASFGTAGTYGPTANSSPGYGGTFTIPQVTTNATGHVTAVTVRTITLPTAQDIPEVETYTGTSPISVSGTTISHETSGVTANSYGPTANSTLSHSGTFVVPQVTVNATGHVTSVTSHTLTLPSDSDTTYTAGTGISLSGTTINHSNSITASNAGPSSASTISPGGTFTVPYIVYDAQGHITSRTNRTMTLNSSILDTDDIVTTITGATSNTTVPSVGAVASAIASLQESIDSLNTKLTEIEESVSEEYMPVSGGTFTGPVGHDDTMSVGNCTMTYNSDGYLQINFV